MLTLLVVTNLLTALVFYQQREMPHYIPPLQNSYKKNCSQTYSLNRPDYPYISGYSPVIPSSLPTLFLITATHAAIAQKVDLTSLCQTVSHVPKLTWIVIEDSKKRTKLVSDILKRCMLESVHLNVETSAKYKSSVPWPLYKISTLGAVRGVEQRNAGLRWLKEHVKPQNSSGVVYFADDDNKYDLRVFSEVIIIFSGSLCI
jgi:galactosylgalactosylxylosylprotein 3-beta-glucuronosyltransferase 3